MSNPASLNESKAIPYSVTVDIEQLQDCHKSLQVSEVLVVWEPVLVGPACMRKIIKDTVKHSFLVFVLKHGQMLYGCEYRYMRVERQQQMNAPPGAEALLTIRFCRDPIVVQGLDIPNLSDAQRQQLTAGDLLQHGIKPLTAQRMQLYHGGQAGSISDTCPRVTLGAAFEAMVSVHRSHPTYCLAKANCMWYVEGVLAKLAAATQEPQLQLLKQKVSSHMRNVAAVDLKPVIDGHNKVLHYLQGNAHGVAADFSTAAAAGAARLGSRAVKATPDAFAGSHRCTPSTTSTTHPTRGWSWCGWCFVLLMCLIGFLH